MEEPKTWMPSNGCMIACVENGTHIAVDDPAYQSILHKAKMMEKLGKMLSAGHIELRQNFGKVVVHTMRGTTGLYEIAPTLTEAIEKIPEAKWVLMLLDAGAQVRNLKDVKWCATEDGKPGKGTGRHIACFILERQEGNGE